ncbi:MAG TPA: hypothetical protein VE643_09975 [Nitrososphaeraceae archaeon]|nr:hypothetical protein [Nitrososphaeraceae archaeon]
MLVKGTVVVAILTITISLSFIVTSSTAGVVFAVSKLADNILPNVMEQPSNHKYSSPLTSIATPGRSSDNAGKTSNVSAKGVAALIMCESDAAANGDLKLSEVRDCYLWAFTLY